MSRFEIKEKAKDALGRNIFGPVWLTALLVFVLNGAIVGAAGSLVPAVGALLITGPLSYGLGVICLRLARGGYKIEIEDMFLGFKNDFACTFLINFMGSIFVILWSLLFVIPGIIKAYAYSMAYFIKADNPEYDWKMCLKASERLMSGHKWDLFILHLSFIGWQILGSLCFGIGAFWVQPYMQVSNAVFYESVKKCAFEAGEPLE